MTINRSHFPPTPKLKPEVLLEVGFDKTAPNEPRDFGSWALGPRPGKESRCDR